MGKQLQEFKGYRVGDYVIIHRHPGSGTTDKGKYKNPSEDVYKTLFPLTGKIDEILIYEGNAFCSFIIEWFAFTAQALDGETLSSLINEFNIARLRYDENNLPIKDPKQY